MGRKPRDLEQAARRLELAIRSYRAAQAARRDHGERMAAREAARIEREGGSAPGTYRKGGHVVVSKKGRARLAEAFGERLDTGAEARLERARDEALRAGLGPAEIAAVFESVSS